MYENATGVTKNIAEAIRWYQLSAKQDNETAQNNLKRLNQTLSCPDIS
jgi:TPR repeat protein